MKTTCYAAGCSASLVGEAPNTLALADGAKDKGWIYFFDSGSGLSGRCLCPAHSPPIKEAVRLLVSVFGERFTHMHLGYVAKLLNQLGELDPNKPAFYRGEPQ